MEWTTLSLVTFVLFLLYKYFMPNKKESGIPGPKKYPIVGSALQLKLDRIPEQFSEFARKYGDLFEIQLFGTVNILLNTSETVNKAFGGEVLRDVLNDRPPIYIVEKAYPKQSVFFSNACKDHSNLRKTLIKGLHVYGDGLPQFEKIVKTEIHRVLNQIEQSNGEQFEVVSLMKRSVCNVMSILLTGEQATEDDYENILNFIYGGDFLANPVNNTLLLTFPVLRYSPIYKDRVDNIFYYKQKLLEKLFYRLKETRTPGISRGLVDWYLEEQEKEQNNGEAVLLNDETIQANIFDVLSAGISTTSSVLSNTILCLINHLEYQTKIQQELDRVIGPDREPSIADKHDCDFLVAVIMESMRYASPVPLTFPHVCKSDVEFEAFKVKANTQLLGNLWHMHHDVAVWGDPWVFRPQRFLDENGKLLPTSHVNLKSLMSFGTGRRKCPGMSLANNRLFLYVSHLLQNWTFLPVPGEGASCDPRGDNYEFNILCTAKPFKCLAKRRNHITQPFHY